MLLKQVPIHLTNTFKVEFIFVFLRPKINKKKKKNIFLAQLSITVETISS